MGQAKTARMWAKIKKEAVLAAAALCALGSMLFVPPSRAYIEYIDFRVLGLLFCLMAVVAGFEQCGLFAVLAQKMLAGRRQLRVLCLLLVLLPFFSAMLITNDVALIIFVPFAILVLSMIGRENCLIPVVVLQTVAANLGSMATPVGNPQNLFLYARYHLSAGEFFAATLPFVLVSLAGLWAATLTVKRESIEVRFPEKERIGSKGRLLMHTMLFALCLMSVFRVLHWGILLAVVIGALLIGDRGLFRRADYSLLATFLCFFIFAGNIGQIGAVRALLAGWLEQSAALTAVISSQLISNVPSAILLSGFTENGIGLLVGTNLGGLGTPIASLASLISLRLYLKKPGAAAGKYLLYFGIANALGLVVLCALAAGLHAF